MSARATRRLSDDELLADGLLTLQEAANELKCSTRTVRRRCKEGLVTVGHGHGLRIPKRAIVEFCKARLVRSDRSA